MKSTSNLSKLSRVVSMYIIGNLISHRSRTRARRSLRLFLHVLNNERSCTGRNMGRIASAARAKVFPRKDLLWLSRDVVVRVRCCGSGGGGGGDRCASACRVLADCRCLYSGQLATRAFWQALFQTGERQLISTWEKCRELLGRHCCIDTEYIPRHIADGILARFFSVRLENRG